MSYYTEYTTIGSAHKPGYRSRNHLPQNTVLEFPVLAGQKIALGDIITLSSGHYASNFFSGNTATSYNTADLRRGMFQALNAVDNTGGSDGDEIVTVVGPGGWADLYAASGVGIGDWVEMDITQDNTARDARTNQLATTVASASRQRVKSISDADLQNVLDASPAVGEATLINPDAYGVVGWVSKIHNRDNTSGKVKSTTATDDLVLVVLGRVRG